MPPARVMMVPRSSSFTSANLDIRMRASSASRAARSASARAAASLAPADFASHSAWSPASSASFALRSASDFAAATVLSATSALNSASVASARGVDGSCPRSKEACASCADCAAPMAFFASSNSFGNCLGVPGLRRVGVGVLRLRQIGVGERAGAPRGGHGEGNDELGRSHGCHPSHLPSFILRSAICCESVWIFATFEASVAVTLASSAAALARLSCCDGGLGVSRP